MPNLSVIIPLYNKEKTIKDTINSVLNQTYQNYELIIVNDGSTDSSLDIVKSINDDRIRIINKQNEGVSKTRNIGVKEAKSKLIFFLDADDYIYPDCFLTLMNLREKYNNVDLWSANYEIKIKSELKIQLMTSYEGIIKEPHKLIYKRKWHFRTGSYIMTRASFEQIGGFSSKLSVGEDWFFMDKYCISYQVAYSPKTIMSYVQESRTLSIKKISCEKTAEWFYSFYNSSIWQKLSYSESILKRIIISFIKHDYISANKLFRKYNKWLTLGIFSSIISLYYKSLKTNK